MTENNNHKLVLAVFEGTDSAETAVKQIPKRNIDTIEAVVIQKDAAGKLNFHDVGHTPTKNTVGGVIGGAVGLLTGGTGLALAILGGILGHHHPEWF